jgi:hypothetical protein
MFEVDTLAVILLNGAEKCIAPDGASITKPEKGGGIIMANEKIGTIDYKALPPLDAETSANMSEEVKVSVLLAVIYYLFLLGVTILNWTSPELMKTVLWGGMTVTWFATSIAAMFMATFIAWLHVLHYQSRVSKNTKTIGEV